MSEPLRGVVEGLRAIVAKKHWRDVRDADLLRHFVETRNSDAFAALMRRHGPMVMGLARRIVRDQQVAEDVFQATFLILARKAKSIRGRDALPAWLHSVALRLATRAKKSRQRLEEKHTHAVKSSPNDPLDEITAREYLTILDEEIAKLPEKYRLPLILCQLEGLSQEEAAKRLGTTSNSIKGMLERGRTLLRQQLTSRGLPAVSLPLGPLALGSTAKAAVGPSLIHSTVQAALTSHGASASAVALAEGAIMMMTIAKLKIICCAAVLCGAIAVGAGWMAAGVGGVEPAKADVKTPAVPVLQAAVKPKKESTKAVDLYGDPLPEGAVMRLGTLRLRHGYPIHWLKFTADGKSLISQAYDGVAIWKADTGERLHFFPCDWEDGKSMPHESASLSSDSKMLAFAGKEAVHIHDPSTGKRLKSIATGPVRFPRFSPDGKMLAVQNNVRPKVKDKDKPNNPFEIWDVESGKQLLVAGGDKAYFACLDFLTDGKSVITAGSSLVSSPPKKDQKICIWDIATGKETQQFPLGILNPRGLAVSPDGKRLAIIGYGEKFTENCIRIWDLALGKEVRQLIHKVEEGYPYGFGTALAFSQDGRILYSGSIGGKLKAWNPITGDELRTFGANCGIPSAMAVSRDGRTIATNVHTNAIRLTDVETGNNSVPLSGHDVYVLYTGFSADGRILVTGQTNHFIAWDSKSGKELYSFRSDTALGLVGFNDGNNRLVTFEIGEVREFNVLQVRDLATGKELDRFRKQESSETLWPPWIGSDGKTSVAAVRKGHRIEIVDLDNAKDFKELGKVAYRESKWGDGYGFSADGRTLVTWGSDKEVEISVWDAKEQRLRKRFTREFLAESKGPKALYQPDVMFKASVSPDGRLVALSHLHVLEVLDLGTGKLIHRIDPLPSSMWSFEFSPDGKTIAMPGQDGFVTLLETATGQVRHRFAGHRGKVLSVGFSADSKTLVSGGDDTTALVWNLYGQELAKTALSKKLSAAELEVCWSELSGDDAAKAYQAIKTLGAASGDAVPFLGAKLSPVPAVDEKRLAQLVADLDKDQFAVRQAAAKELEQIGEAAAGYLEKAISAKSSLELTRRVQGLLEAWAKEWHNPSPANLRILRALEALEMAGTPQARAVLERLASGASGARITQEASAAVARHSRIP